ncbi:MAG: serine hydrolase [Pseudomonadota bacterium]
MRKLLFWILRIVLALCVAALVVAIWKREELQRLYAVNTLFDENRIVSNFSDMEGAFLTAHMPRSASTVNDLPAGPTATLPAEVDPWITDRFVTSLLVAKSGAVVHESYYLGTGSEDQRISWSIAKSYLSALFGIVMAEGHIASLDDPVTQYAPSLENTAYANATVRNVLNMASGVVFDEDYLDYDSDINRMGRVIALGGNLDDFAASLSETFAAPGQTWQYVSIDTHVIGMVLRGATGQSVVDLLRVKILDPLQPEADAYYITDGDGVAFVLGGLNITTRDYARFGIMIEQSGQWNGQQIVPADWVAASTRASAPTEPGKTQYGYQWWSPSDARPGEFFGRGIYGQYLYIDQQKDIVIVVTAADRKFRERGVHTSNIEVLRRIADQI